MTTVAVPDDPSLVDASEVARALATDIDQGLPSQEVARRLAEDGPNRLRAAATAPAWQRVVRQFRNPLVYLLLAAIAIALAAWGVEGWVGWPIDAVVIAGGIAGGTPWLPGERWLRRLQNEAQMLLHAHPVNLARMARGALAVNSVWIHGAGAPADPVSRRTTSAGWLPTFRRTRCARR